MEEKKIGRRTFLKAAAISTAAVGAANLSKASSSAAQESAVQKTGFPHKELGNTGVQVPILQLGTAQRLNPVYDKIMHRCFKEGVTWFDTALSYGWGSSHRAIANFLTQVKDRKKMWLTSKSGSGSPKGLQEDINECLEELKTNYIDLYLMHGIDDEDMLEKEFINLGDRLRKSGKTRFFGFSCHDGNVVELMNKAAKVGGIDAILFRYNFRRYGDRELNLAIDACKKAGIGLLAMKTNGSVPASIEKVVQFRSDNFTLGQAKLKSVWADERIDSVVSEMDSIRVARENIAAAKSEKHLTATESHQLNQLAALTANYACNGCAHICESVVDQKVAIADSLRFLMYYECYGKTEHARQLYNGIPAQSRICGEEQLQKAAAVCPQGIDIAARLFDAQRTLAV
ncbi:MAG: aldo/keto reductase [SAR324 cluster bacterium]|nr:aldo/keto reductase [SAR324 cluster bacterium]